MSAKQFLFLFFLAFPVLSQCQADMLRQIREMESEQYERPYYSPGKDGVDKGVQEVLESDRGFDVVLELDGMTPGQLKQILDSLIELRMFVPEFIMYTDTFIYTNLSDGTDDIANYPYYYAFERSEKNKRVLMEFLLESSYLAECGLLDELSVLNRKIIYSWLRGSGYDVEYSREEVFEKVQSTLIESNDSHSIDCLGSNLSAIYRR